MKTIVTLIEYLTLIWWLLLVILFFGIFMTAHKISQQKEKKNQSLILSKRDMLPDSNNKQE